MTSLRSIRWIKAVSPYSPLIALALIAILPIVLNHPPVDQSSIQARNRQVAAAFDQAPWRIGEWNAEPLKVLPAAVEILRPNAILSRRFKSLNDNFYFDVMIIHCTDARDMDGHFPPVCFPAHGWGPSDEPSDH